MRSWEEGSRGRDSNRWMRVSKRQTRRGSSFFFTFPLFFLFRLFFFLPPHVAYPLPFSLSPPRSLFYASRAFHFSLPLLSCIVFALSSILLSFLFKHTRQDPPAQKSIYTVTVVM